MLKVLIVKRGVDIYKLNLLYFVAIFLLSGCKAVGPDYERPQIDTPQTFRFLDENTSNNLANTKWWQQFEDPVLNELIATALEDNRDVKIAAARIEEYIGRYGTTRSQLFPQVGADANAARQRVTENSGPEPLSPSADRNYSSYQGTISASWELDIWGKLRRQSEAARAEVLASEEGRRAVVLTLVSTVAASYINLRDLDLQLEIAKATEESRRASLKIFELRYEASVISEMVLAQNRSEYEFAVASIPPIEMQIAQQENALSLLLGRNPGPIPRGQSISKLDLPAIPEGLPSDLLERRPDIVQAEQNLIAANAQIGAAKALYYPTISLTGLLGVSSTQLSNLFSSSSGIWTFAGDASIPIFTAGGIAGQVKQSEAIQQQALLQYQQSIQSAFSEVSNALIQHQKTKEQLAALEKELEALRTYARLAILSYDNGYSSYLEVLDAQTSLFNAELNYAQVQGTFYTSMVDIYKSMGGGWVVQAEGMTEPSSSILNEQSTSETPESNSELPEPSMLENIKGYFRDLFD